MRKYSRNLITVLLFCCLLHSVSAGAVFAAQSCTHKWSRWTVTRTSTCAKKGAETRTCKVCGREETRRIPLSDDHKWTEWIVGKPATCAASGYWERTCAVCGKLDKKKIPASGNHPWSSWKILKKATIRRRGLKTRVCLQCRKTQTVRIPKKKPYVRFTQSVYTVRAGKTLKLKKRIRCAAGDRVRSWRSSDSTVAGIGSGGRLYALRPGTARITVVMKSGKKAACVVQVGS